MNYEAFKQNSWWSVLLCLDRTILLLIGNYYYCLYRIILLGTNSAAYIKQHGCLFPPILLPNLEPSCCPKKNGIERYSLSFNYSKQSQNATPCINRKIPVKS